MLSKLEDLTDEQLDTYIQLLSEEKARRIMIKEKNIELISTLKTICNNLFNKLYTTIMDDYLYKDVQEDKEEMELKDI